MRRKDPRQAQVSLIIRLLNRRLGEVELSLINRVQRLSIEQVESLGEALLDFSEVTDLVKWLDELEQQEE
ncbi:DUF4351 domain-containing protein [Symplocastrum sp. BBK-W-15]|uniref:DUF4351 domain-containing protein n=1 Tax=Limnofasciculus baicalensis BBK-W-15 TaxID=2699891 RepID=A0AAE3KKV2_9CYAN|nr:DUF4351 domain-containing protein [Limnofasciculus baicalensis BBK-W-15]